MLTSNKCVVLNCRTECKNTDSPNEATVHKFPLNDPDSLRQWLSFVNRKDFTPMTNSVLCSRHFNDNDFETEKLEIFLPKTKKMRNVIIRKLKSAAVPSENRQNGEEKDEEMETRNLAGRTPNLRVKRNLNTTKLKKLPKKPTNSRKKRTINAKKSESNGNKGEISEKDKTAMLEQSTDCQMDNLIKETPNQARKKHRKEALQKGEQVLMPVFKPKTPEQIEIARLRAEKAKRKAIAFENRRKAEEMRQKDAVKNVDEIVARLETETITEEFEFRQKDGALLITQTSWDASRMPLIDNCIVIFENLKVLVFVKYKPVPKSRYSEAIPNDIAYFDQLRQLLALVKSWTSNPQHLPWMDMSISCLNNEIVDTKEGELLKKLIFIREQMQLAKMSPTARRYSSQLVDFSLAIRKLGMKVYDTVQSQNMLSLPADRTLCTVVNDEKRKEAGIVKVVPSKKSKIVPVENSCTICKRERSGGNLGRIFPFPAPGSDQFQTWKEVLSGLNITREYLNEKGGIKSNFGICWRHFLSSQPSDQPDHLDFAPSIRLWGDEDMGNLSLEDCHFHPLQTKHHVSVGEEDIETTQFAIQSISAPNAEEFIEVETSSRDNNLDDYFDEQMPTLDEYVDVEKIDQSFQSKSLNDHHSRLAKKFNHSKRSFSSKKAKDAGKNRKKRVRKQIHKVQTMRSAWKAPQSSELELRRQTNEHGDYFPDEDIAEHSRSIGNRQYMHVDGDNQSDTVNCVAVPCDQCRMTYYWPMNTLKQRILWQRTNCQGAMERFDECVQVKQECIYCRYRLLSQDSVPLFRCPVCETDTNITLDSNTDYLVV